MARIVDCMGSYSGLQHNLSAVIHVWVSVQGVSGEIMCAYDISPLETGKHGNFVMFKVGILTVGLMVCFHNKVAVSKYRRDFPDIQIALDTFTVMY